MLIKVTRRHRRHHIKGPTILKENERAFRLESIPEDVSKDFSCPPSPVSVQAELESDYDQLVLVNRARRRRGLVPFKPSENLNGSPCYTRLPWRNRARSFTRSLTLNNSWSCYQVDSWQKTFKEATALYKCIKRQWKTDSLLIDRIYCASTLPCSGRLWRWETMGNCTVVNSFDATAEI